MPSSIALAVSLPKRHSMNPFRKWKIGGRQGRKQAGSKSSPYSSIPTPRASLWHRRVAHPNGWPNHARSRGSPLLLRRTGSEEHGHTANIPNSSPKREIGGCGQKKMGFVAKRPSGAGVRAGISAKYAFVSRGRDGGGIVGSGNGADGSGRQTGFCLPAAGPGHRLGSAGGCSRNRPSSRTGSRKTVRLLDSYHREGGLWAVGPGWGGGRSSGPGWGGGSDINGEGVERITSREKPVGDTVLRHAGAIPDRHPILPNRIPELPPWYCLLLRLFRLPQYQRRRVGHEGRN